MAHTRLQSSDLTYVRTRRVDTGEPKIVSDFSILEIGPSCSVYVTDDKAEWFAAQLRLAATAIETNAAVVGERTAEGIRVS